MAIKICGQDVRVLTTCPPGTAQFLAFNIPGELSGAALYSWDTLKCCLLYQMFGAGIVEITGNDLVLGIYQNTNLVSDLLIYANNITKFLTRGDDPDAGAEWNYVRNDAGKVVGVEIFIGYLPDDEFKIFPNPSCTGTPVADYPEGINTRFPTEGFYEGTSPVVIPWTDSLKTKYGKAAGTFKVYQNSGGGFQITSLDGVPDDIDNPTQYSFDTGGIPTYIILP